MLMAEDLWLRGPSTLYEACCLHGLGGAVPWLWWPCPELAISILLY